MEFNHICALEDSEGNPYKKESFTVNKIFELSNKNPRTKYYFRSLAAIEEQKRSHREIKHNIIIHPLSLLRFYLDCILLIVLTIGLIVIPINLILPPFSHKTIQLYDATSEAMEIFCDFIYFCDIILTFFTGYCIVGKKDVVLKQKDIAKMYVTSSEFYVDLVSAYPTYAVIFFLDYYYTNALTLTTKRYMEVASIVKLLRLRKFLKYYKFSSELIRQWYFLRLALKYLFLVIIGLHWATCIFIMLSQFVVYHTGDPFSADVLNADYLTMYCRALYITVSYCLCISLVSGFQRIYDARFDSIEGIIIFIAYAIIGFLFTNLLLVLILQMVLSINSSEIKYHSIIAQLIQYMRYKDLPKSMRNRILSYYEYRFQKKYFRESTILDMLSETLRRDINLHSCRTLIENVSLLKDLPQDIISEVVSNLKHEVFLYNDVIVKAGTIGDCMYFIANGTVAVSTPTGKEICHLQDGAYFGEIALISKDQRRIANVIAIEICEIYRLDRRNFRSCFQPNSPFYKRIEQIAQERMEKTVLLEELHKKYILDKTTKRKAEESTRRQSPKNPSK